MIRQHLDYLIVRGPLHGSFPETTKSILIVFPQNVAQTEDFFRGYELHIVTERPYLGGFLRSKAAKDLWLREKLEGCQDLVATLVGVARQH